MIAIGVVVLIHVLLGYAFITGLALKAVKAVVNKVEAVNIKDKAPPPDEPPPPPPRDIEIPPYVPPPVVSIAQDAAPVITTTRELPPPEPPRYIAPPAPAAPAPKVEAPTPATPKGRGNTFTDDDFPDSSRRAEESGTTRVVYTIGTDGRVTDCNVTQSSGFPRLDEATCKIIMRRYRFNPATREGQPVAETRPQSIKWKLTEAR